MSGGRVVFLDQAASTVTVSPPTIANDGVAFATITVRLVHTDGRPMPGLPVTVASTGSGNTLTQPVGVTNQDGVATGSIVSTGVAVKTISGAATGVTLTDTASLDVGGTETIAFGSQWGTATGSGDAALRDTDKALPWGSVSGSNTNVEVIASTGLDFPTTNVLSVQTLWNGSGSSSKIIRRTGLGVPAVGESRFYRWYIRIAVPDGISMGTPHPIQDGADSATSNWEFETRAGSTGTWSPIFTFDANTSPNNRWGALNALDRNATYRVELGIARLTTTTFTASVRVFDSAGVQVLDDSDFLNATGTGGTSLASTPTLTFVDVSYLDGFTMGTNGAFQGSVSGDHPLQFCYQGAAAISDDTWLGPYSAPEP